MYLGCYCESQGCGQFHLVHYIGLTSQTTFTQPEGWWDYECPDAEPQTVISGLTWHPLRVTRLRNPGSRGFDCGTPLLSFSARLREHTAADDA